MLYIYTGKNTNYTNTFVCVCEIATYNPNTLTHTYIPTLPRTQDELMSAINM